MRKKPFFHIELLGFPPLAKGKKKKLEWICSTLNLDSTDLKILKLIFSSKEGIKSGEIEKHFKISQAAVIYRLNKLIKMGMLRKEGRRYVGRSLSLLSTIEEMEKDVLRIFSELKKMAKEIDKI